MAGKDVKNLYHLGHARWYDFFKRYWNYLVSSKAEQELGRFLKKNLDKNASILELGCGTALNLEKIDSMGLKFRKYVGVDFSPDMLRIARRKFKGESKVKFIEKDLTRLGMKGKFDIIICTWVLSHLECPSELVNNAQGMLKRDGKMFIIFFSRPKWYVNFFVYPFARLFSANPVSKDEVKRFNKVKWIRSYSAGIATAMQIHR